MTKLEQIRDYAMRADLVDSGAVMWLVNRCEKLEKALRFYADPMVYGSPAGHPSEVEVDDGKLATEALKE